MLNNCTNIQKNNRANSEKMKKNEIENLRIAAFNYSLPDEKIAKYPLEKRDTSKLLLYEKGGISSASFHRLADFIPEESLLLFNNTRVIHARLLFRKNTGAVIEVFCLSPNTPSDYALNFQSRRQCTWNCMIGNAKRWKDDSLHLKIETSRGEAILTARKTGKPEGDTLVEFSWDNPSFTFSELLEAVGKLPIPPYLNRASEEKDDETYQTVYARVEGSVAAPTAGLHFTDAVTENLREKSISTADVTLHVGAGTFKPVKSETIAQHDMHTEFISIPKETIEKLYLNQKALVVVGTTSMRTVESLYYIGKKIGENPQVDKCALSVSQWEPYEQEDEIPPRQALKNILDYLQRTGQEQLIAATQIMIAPGYGFHYPDAIVTNFHQPQSTLLLLISAFVGDDWKKIYAYALEHNFRFLSYGDSSLLWKNKM